MGKKETAGGPLTRTAVNAAKLAEDLTARLASTKGLLLGGYNFGGLTLIEAESFARRMRRRYPFSWRRA